MNKLTLKSIYLDYSYTGHFNPQTRFFIHIPDESKTFTLWFEMNSAFSKHADSLMTVMQKESQIFKVPSISPSKGYCKFYPYKENLYENMPANVNDFLNESYSENWNLFIEVAKQKYCLKNKIPLMDFKVPPIEQFKVEVKKTLSDILLDKNDFSKIQMRNLNSTPMTQEGADELLSFFSSIPIKQRYVDLNQKLPANTRPNKINKI